VSQHLGQVVPSFGLVRCVNHIEDKEEEEEEKEKEEEEKEEDEEDSAQPTSLGCNF